MFIESTHVIIPRKGTTLTIRVWSISLLGIQFILIVFIIMVVIILIRRNFVEFVQVGGEETAIEGEKQEVEAIAWVRTLARRKVELPALFLMGMGGINLVMGAVLCGRTVQMVFKPIEEFEQEYREAREITGKIFPEAGRMLDQQEWDGPAALRQTILINLGASVTVLLGSWLLVAGGWRMRQLKSFSLAMAGSLFCAIPCLSCGGCIGIGQIVSIWAILVLIDPMVRAAFRNGDTLQARQDDHFC